MPRRGHLEAGGTAERQARQYLETRGLTHLSSNYRCRLGELDLIMRDDEELVIVEIRYRRRTDFMHPVESITAAKQRRVARAAQYFLRRHPQYQDRPVRFDVVCVTGPLSRSRLEWIPAAFTAEHGD